MVLFPLWSDNPYAPKIPYPLYFVEKVTFAGMLVGTIFYGTHVTPSLIRLPSPPSAYFPIIRSVQGIVIVLFFQCMAALFNPVYHKGEGIKWGLVSYIVAMFSLATAFTAMNLNTQSVSFIDNRECNYSARAPNLNSGPLIYQWFIRPTVLTIPPNLVFLLSYWLADGLLVSSLFDAAFIRPGLTLAPPLALSLLRIVR